MKAERTIKAVLISENSRANLGYPRVTWRVVECLKGQRGVEASVRLIWKSPAINPDSLRGREAQRKAKAIAEAELAKVLAI